MTTRQQLVDEFLEQYGLVMGERGDDSAHAYLSRGKVLVKKAGILKIQMREKIYHDQPKLDSIAGRAVVCGYWYWPQNEDEKGYNKGHWTTGEGDPKGKAVEGQYPIAMAEKRWRARGVLDLVLPPDLSTLIYSEEEMPADYGKPAEATERPQERPRESAAPRAPRERKPRSGARRASAGKADVASLGASWKNAIEQVSELVGVDEREMNEVLLPALAAFELDNGDIIRLPKDVDTFKELAGREKGPGWAKGTLGKIETLVEDLQRGLSVTIRQPVWTKDKGVHWGPEVELSPLGEGNAQPELDYDEVPF